MPASSSLGEASCGVAQWPIVVTFSLMCPLLTLLFFLSHFSTPSLCFVESSQFGNALIFQGPAKYKYLYKTCPELFRTIKSLSPVLLFLFTHIFLYLSLCIMSLCTSFTSLILSVCCQCQVRRENGDLVRQVGNYWEEN